MIVFDEADQSPTPNFYKGAFAKCKYQTRRMLDAVIIKTLEIIW